MHHGSVARYNSSIRLLSLSEQICIICRGPGSRFGSEGFLMCYVVCDVPIFIYILICLFLLYLIQLDMRCRFFLRIADDYFPSNDYGVLLKENSIFL